MICSTLSTSTAYWITDRQLRSEWTTTLAMLRWTKTSPGIRPMISFAGTRLSAQPIHRYLGVCCAASFWKNCGSLAVICAAHERLLSKRCFSTRIVSLHIRLTIMAHGPVTFNEIYRGYVIREDKGSGEAPIPCASPGSGLVDQLGAEFD